MTRFVIRQLREGRAFVARFPTVHDTKGGTDATTTEPVCPGDDRGADQRGDVRGPGRAIGDTSPVNG